MSLDPNHDDGKERLRSLIELLLCAKCDDFKEACRVLRAYLQETPHGLNPNDRHVARLIGHLLFLLEDGETLFAHCEFRYEGQMDGLIEIKRISFDENGFHKVFVRITAAALAPDSNAFQEYTNGPSIVVYRNPLRVLDASSASNKRLNYGELRELFSNRQRLKDEIRARRDERGRSFQALMKECIESDLKVVCKAFDTCMAQEQTTEVPISRNSHPYKGPQLLILPRLIHVHDSRSVLTFIADNLSLIRSYGFAGVMLSPVDRQSTNLYYGETLSGELIEHTNNHGYWCSGEIGIDSFLGTEEDYQHLVCKANALGMHYTQDCTFATLGYLPQIERLRLSSEIGSARMSLTIGGGKVELSDPEVFLHETGIEQEDGLDGRISSERYALAHSRMYLGTSYGLPRPNLYLPEVREGIMQRSLWQVYNADVNSFRIDMSKHMGVTPLREVIKTLRFAVENLQTSDRHVGKSFSAVLEYWTLNYRDIRIASLILGQECTGCYLYDFPLAAAIQDILIKERGFYSTVKRLLRERDRWMINLLQLIPTFIDHDFLFRPIYNGSQSTSAMVVVGYALCLVLSANGPIVYFGYQNAQSGVADMDNYFTHSEQFSRKDVDEIIATDDEWSPAIPLANLFARFHERAVLEQWDGGRFDISGDDDGLDISRIYLDRLTGNRMVVSARFSRFVRDLHISENCDDVLFRHIGTPSVVIWTYSEDMQSLRA